MKKILFNKITIFTLGLALVLAVNVIALTGAWFTDSSCTSGIVEFGGLNFSLEPQIVESGFEEGRIMPGDTLDLELSYAVTGDDAWIRVTVGAFIDGVVDFECLLVAPSAPELANYQIESEIPGVFYLLVPVSADVVQTSHLQITFDGWEYWDEYEYTPVNYFIRVDAVQHTNIPTLFEAKPVFDALFALPDPGGYGNED
jgi:hypothetical protein